MPDGIRQYLGSENDADAVRNAVLPGGDGLYCRSYGGLYYYDIMQGITLERPDEFRLVVADFYQRFMYC